jgi:hypothetical protein
MTLVETKNRICHCQIVFHLNFDAGIQFAAHPQKNQVLQYDQKRFNQGLCDIKVQWKYLKIYIFAWGEEVCDQDELRHEASK